MLYKIPAPLEIILGMGLLQIRSEEYIVRVFLTGLADLIVIMHFSWILFMLVGFIFTVAGFFWKDFFDRWLFRMLHLCGIAYVSLLALLGKYCPLTIWENTLRQKYAPNLTYPGSFMIHYVEKLVYPDINPLIIRIPTTFIAVFTILVFLIRPPKKIKKMWIMLAK